MVSDLLPMVLRANLVLAAAILVILALRPVVTRRFGARTTYLLWAVAPLALLAAFLPAPPSRRGTARRARSSGIEQPVR